jgi:hypothetical protein
VWCHWLQNLLNRFDENQHLIDIHRENIIQTLTEVEELFLSAQNSFDPTPTRTQPVEAPKAEPLTSFSSFGYPQANPAPVKFGLKQTVSSPALGTMPKQSMFPPKQMVMAEPPKQFNPTSPSAQEGTRTFKPPPGAVSVLPFGSKNSNGFGLPPKKTTAEPEPTPVFGGVPAKNNQPDPLQNESSQVHPYAVIPKSGAPTETKATAPVKSPFFGLPPKKAMIPPPAPTPVVAPNQGGFSPVKSTGDPVKARSRNMQIEEIIASEREYSANLTTLRTIFIVGLKFTGALSESDAAVLFSVVETLASLSNKVLGMWESRDRSRDEATVLADVFMDVINFLKIYKTYLINHPKAVEKLEELKQNPKFVDSLRRCETNPEAKNRPLVAFLLLPVQRICRYPQLLSDLLKHVEDPVTVDKLAQTKSQIESILQLLNEGTTSSAPAPPAAPKQDDRRDPLSELQSQIEGYKGQLSAPNRRLVRQGTLVGRERGEEKAEPSMHVVLCNDLLLITKQKINPKTGKGSYEFRKEIDLNNPFMRLIAVDSEFKGGKTAFLITTEKQSFCFFAATVEEKESWMKDIRDQKKDTIKRLTSNMQEYRRSLKLNAPIIANTQMQSQTKNSTLEEYEQLLNELEGNANANRMGSDSFYY